MVFAKVTKTSAYFSRFQVKPRRRREGKTDYKARRNMIRQDCCKYNTPKYRFIVRFTNKRVICQIAYATLTGDRIIAGADSFELKDFGMPVGLTNYAAAYATGLLCARRVLRVLKMDDICVGRTKVDGAEYHIEEEETERSPFKCYLDVGLVRTTTGNRVFGALKGAVDGGLHIPHSTKRFPGYTRGQDGAEDNYDPEAHRRRIFALHVADYMKLLKEEDSEKYEQTFSQYIKAGVTPDNLEQKIQALHDSIRQNPDRKVKEKKVYSKPVRDGNYIILTGTDGQEVRVFRPKKLTKDQRRARVEAKIAEVARLAAAALEE